MTICTLASSSSGNCSIVSHGNTHILIDAGISLRRIRTGLHHFGLSPDDLDGVFVTHEHSDHISGLEMLTKYHKIPVFSSFGGGVGICGAVTWIEPFLSCFEIGAALEIGDISVCSFCTPHDAAGSVGYTVLAGGKKFVYVTDLGHVSDVVAQAAAGADIAMIEANHDIEMLRRGPYPAFLKRRVLSDHGHLANKDSGEFAAKLADSGTRNIQLSHLSRQNNTPELALATVERALSAKGITPARDVELDVAPPYEMGRVYVV